MSSELLLGEFRRTIDDRFRLNVPNELANKLAEEGTECVLAKERPGCVSLWEPTAWKARLDASVQIVRTKAEAGRLDHRLADLQRFGRLLSTRHRTVQLAGRGRLVVPEGFREFLKVEPGGEVMVVGAAVCIEIWQIDAWLECLDTQIADFGKLLDELAN